MNKEKNKTIVYYFFGLALFLFQFLGYNVLSLGMLMISSIALLNLKSFPRNLKANNVYAWFLVLALGVAALHGLNGLPTTRSLQVWGQFFFFSILFLIIKDKEDILRVITIFVFVISAMDVITNLLLFAGLDLPWAHLPSVRPGEVAPRYPGVKGNQLYSGSITYAAICLFLNNRNWRTSNFVILALLFFNIILSGSKRYFIILAIVGLLFFFNLYKKKFLLFFVCIAAISIVTLSAIYEVSTIGNEETSNAMRVYLWGMTINNILNHPLAGIGLFSPDLGVDFVANINNLEEAGVTESTILSIGLCFGIPCLIFFLMALAKTLSSFTSFQKYSSVLGLFIGFALDLFWGGSLENSISLCVFVLSMYIINDNYILNEKNHYVFNSNSNL